MSLYVAESGSRDRPTIVLLHGGGGAGWMWKPQVEALSPEYHVLVPDLPGQGRSISAGRFTMASAAEQVSALVAKRSRSGRAHVVGLSEGAQVVLELLGTTPSVVESAIVSSALVLPLKAGRWLSSERTLHWTYRYTMKPLADVDWWIRWNMRGAAGVPERYFDEFRETFRSLSEEGFVDLMTANQSFRLPSGLAEATAPVLAVCGAGEYSVMKRSTRAVAEALPNARACEVRLPGNLPVAQQHNWNLTAPEVFSAMVRAWIEGTALPDELAELEDA